MFRITTLQRPAEQPDPAAAATLRGQILDLNLKLTDAPAFVANWRARIDGFLDDMEWLDLVWLGERLVGHYGMRLRVIDGRALYYVDNFTIDPEMQGRGLARKLTARSVVRLVSRSLGRDVYMVSRTQNPIIAAGIWGALNNPAHTFPVYDGRPVRPQIRELAAAAAHAMWPDKPYDRDTGVLVGAYGGRFLPVGPTWDADVAAHFERHVDMDRGDAVVHICRLTFGAWAQMLRYFTTHRVRRLLGKPRGGAVKRQTRQHGMG